MIVAVISLVFSVLFIWSPATPEQLWEDWSPFFMTGVALLLGIPVYLAQQSQ